MDQGKWPAACCAGAWMPGALTSVTVGGCGPSTDSCTPTHAERRAGDRSMPLAMLEGFQTHQESRSRAEAPVVHAAAAAISSRSRFMWQSSVWQAGRVSRSTQPELDALIAEATVDCYNESECVRTYTVLVNQSGGSFPSEVLGVDVTVTGVDLTEAGRIVAVCMRGAATQRVPILDLPLPTPSPEGAQ